MTPTQLAHFTANVETILAIAYNGIHHVRGWDRAEFRQQSVTVIVRDDLPTCDHDYLTMLVLGCHSCRIRMTVKASNPGHLKLIFTPRGSGTSYTEDHPSIEKSIEKFNRFKAARNAPNPTK